MNRHLIELRTRVIKCALVFSAFFCICFYYSNELYAQLAKLIDAPLIATHITAPFMVPLQLSLFCSLLLSIPYILYHAWQFIAPGLYLQEKRNIAPWIIISCILFYLGIIFALFIMAPLAINFFINYANSAITVMIDIGNYLDFIVTLAIAAGVAFQVPIITVFLIKSGIISKRQLAKQRPYVIVLSFILGMLLTPPDVVSQILLALPMWGLFELGLAVCFEAKYDKCTV